MSLFDKLLLVSIQNNKIDAYLGQVRLSKGQLSPAGLGKGLGYDHAVSESPTGAINR